MIDTTFDNDELARLAIGGGALKRRRLSRRLIAKLMGTAEQGEDGQEELLGDSADNGSEERRLLRLLAGSRVMRQKRLRRLLMAHLLRGGSDAESEGEDIDEEGAGSERKLARLLVGSRMLRQKRLRRLLVAHLLREGSQVEDTSDEDEEGLGEDGVDRERRLAGLLVGSRLLRRRRVRRALLAHLLSERGEAEDEGEDIEDEQEGEGGERRLARLLVGSRLLRRRRVRRALLAHLLSERAEAEDEGEDIEGDEEGESELARILVGGRMRQTRRARRALLVHLLRERGEEI